jgi:hypothetical protein
MCDLTAVTSIANFLRQNGLPPAGGDTATAVAIEALRRLPGTVTASVASLGASAMLIRGKRTSPQFKHWRAASLQGRSAGSVLNGYTTTSATSAGQPATASQAAIDATYYDLTGHDGAIIAVSGATANTSVVDWELVYHLEVVPRAENLLTSLRPPQQNALAPPGSEERIQLLQQRLNHVTVVPHHFRELSAGTLANGMAKLISGTAGSVVAQAMRAGMGALESGVGQLMLGV